MLTTDVAINVLASALWELGVKPLYQGATSLVSPPSGRRRQPIDAAIRNASGRLSAAESATDVPSTAWEDFFGLDEVQTLVQDLFMFRMDSSDPSVDEIRVAFEYLWDEFASDCGIASDSVQIAVVFGELAAAATEVLDAAVQQDVLSAHEAKALARHSVVEARLEAIESLLSGATSTRASARNYLAFEAQLRHEVGLRHSKIEPPSLLGRERVDLDRLFVSPRLGVANSQLGYTPVAFDQFVHGLHRRVVLGNPGAGKSTLAAKVCHLLASEYADPVVSRRPLTPWIIELRRFAALSPPRQPALVDYFEEWARTSYQLTVPAGAFEWLLGRGRLLVAFDGLDELLDTSHRQDVRNMVESFCRRYATTPVLVTSRIVGYDQAPLDPHSFDAVRLLDFDLPRVQHFASNWFELRLDTEPPEKRYRQTAQFMRDSAVAGELRNNPLMLGLLASLHRGPGSIPNNLPDVYDRCATLLFSTWDKERDIEVVLPFAEHVRPALRDLAWWIFNSPKLSSDGVTRRQAITRTAKYLGRHRFGDEDRARAAAEDFINFCRGRAWVFSDQGSTSAGEDLFGFTHRTFMEFFAAEHVAYRKETAEDLVARVVPLVAQQQWDIVALIALQIKARSYPEGADDVVVAYLKELKAQTGAALLHGVNFLLRLLHAAIPRPAITRMLGAQLTIFALREGRSLRSDSEVLDEGDIFAAIASVGSEIRDELAIGVAAAEAKLVADVSPLRQALGSELIFRSGDVLAHRGIPSDDVVAFWRAAGDRVVANDRERIVSAAASNRDVALDAWPRLINLRFLVERHGAASVFASRPLDHPGEAARPPIEHLLASAADRSGAPLRPVAAWRALAEVGEILSDGTLPMFRLPTPGLVSGAVEPLADLARLGSRRLMHMTPHGRLAIWLAAALAAEDLVALAKENVIRTVATERMDYLLQGLARGRHPYWAALTSALARRYDTHVPQVTDGDASALGLPDSRAFNSWRSGSCLASIG